MNHTDKRASYIKMWEKRGKLFVYKLNIETNPQSDVLEVFTPTQCLNMKLLLTIILFDTFCFFYLTNIIYTFYSYAFVFLFFSLKENQLIVFSLYLQHAFI